MGNILRKLGSSRTKTPKAVVNRGKGKTFKKNPKAFDRGVLAGGMPSTNELFNVGGLPNIPTGNIADLDVSGSEGRRLLRKSGKVTG